MEKGRLVLDSWTPNVEMERKRVVNVVKRSFFGNSSLRLVDERKMKARRTRTMNHRNKILFNV